MNTNNKMAVLAIMIGSLWDLKLANVGRKGSAGIYHDRFPMGFETGVLPKSYKVLSYYHDRFPMGFETHNNNGFDDFCYGLS